MRNDLGVFDRGGAHQHRLAALKTFTDVLNGSVVLFTGCLVDPIQLVLATARSVGRHHHRLQPVDFLELVGLSVGRASHAGKFAVKPEIVLKGDRRHGLVFWLDRHTFLGLHRLVQALAPAPPAHQATGELIHDDDLALLHHVMLVAVVQVVGPQRRVQVVHQRDVGRVIQRGAFRDQSQLEQNALRVLMALLSQEDLAAFLVQREITRLGDALAGARIGLALLPLQLRHHLVDGDIQAGVVFGLTADDQRRTRLVDQDGVHLVDDGVVETALHAVAHLVNHVVAQVVKTVFVVGAVGDVGTVGRLLLFSGHIGQIDTHRQPEKIVEFAHPLRIAVGQVVVDRDHMHAFAGQCVQVNRQCGGQGLALASAHFRNFAVVQGHAAQQLHIEVAHFHDALGTLAHHGKGLGQQGVQRLTRGDAVLEQPGLGAQVVVGQPFEFSLHRIDAHYAGPVLFKQAVVATAEDLGQKICSHAFRACPTIRTDRSGSAILLNLDKWVGPWG